MLYKFANTALVAHGFLARLSIALITQRNTNARIEECLLAQTVFQNIIFKNSGFKNFGVSAKTNDCAGFLGAGHGFHGRRGLTALEAHKMLLFTVAYLGFHPFGQRINNRRTNAVQTARNLIASAAELAAGMENG